MNDKGYRLLSTFERLTVLSILHLLTHLVLIISLRIGFAISTAMVEGTKVQRGEDIGPRTHSLHSVEQRHKPRSGQTFFFMT